MFLLVYGLSRTVEDACPYVRYRNIVCVILFVFLGTSKAPSHIKASQSLNIFERLYLYVFT